MNKLYAFIITLLVASDSNAQAAYSIINFTPTSIGFTSTLLFQNTNLYSDSRRIGISHVIVRSSSRIVSSCLVNRHVCTLGSGGQMSYAYGELQTNTFTRDNTIFAGNNWFVEDSCASNCWSRMWFTTASSMLGCPLLLTGYVNEYAGRTCGSEGYIGSMAINLRFENRGILPGFNYDVSDLSVEFITRDLGENKIIYTTNPEPSTWILLLMGVGVIYLIRYRAIKR